jgi:signal transduction histidine kinase
MKKKWTKLDQREKTRYVLRAAIVLLMATLMLYIIFIEAELVANHDHYHSEFAPLVFCLTAIMMGWTLYLQRKSKKPSMPLNILEYITLSMFMILLSGFTPAIFVFWLILLILSALFFSKRGLVLGILTMFIATLMTYFLNHTGVIDWEVLSGGLAGAVTAAVAAVTISMLSEYTGVSQYIYEQVRQDSVLQHERLEATINSISEAIIATDANGYIKVYNAAAMALLDTNVNLEAKKIEKFVKIKQANGRLFTLWEYAREQERFFTRDDLILVYPNGDKVDLSISCSPIAGEYKSFRTGRSEHGGFVLLLRDITKQKNLDEERDEFISVISHELRTPAAVAEGALSNLQFLLERQTDPKVMLDQVKSAYKQILYLENMINDVGTLSRAQRGVGADEESINVKKLAEDLLAQYTPEAEKNSLKFKLNLGANLGAVRTSKLYLQEILQNLITNALKYTKKGSVTLSIQNRGDKLLFAVIDTGIGISRSDQPRVFEKFFRSEDFRTRESSGTGLGLYITAKLAKMIGIYIKLESKLDEGSTFSFELPKDK